MIEDGENNNDLSSEKHKSVISPHLLQWKKFSAPPILQIPNKVNIWISYACRLKKSRVSTNQTCRCRIHHNGTVFSRPCNSRKENVFHYKEANLLNCMILNSKMKQNTTSSSKKLHFEQKYFPMQTPQLMQCC